MRNTWIRRISAIRKDGVESAINLTCGLNCVIGASNTGKTRIAKTVEFVCGGKETPFTDKTAYEVAQVTFITNDGEVSLSRSTRTQNTIHVESSNPAVASGSYSVSSRSGKSINTVLLALLGIEPTRSHLFGSPTKKSIACGAAKANSSRPRCPYHLTYLAA